MDGVRKKHFNVLHTDYVPLDRTRLHAGHINPLCDVTNSEFCISLLSCMLNTLYYINRCKLCCVSWTQILLQGIVPGCMQGI